MKIMKIIIYKIKYKEQIINCIILFKANNSIFLFAFFIFRRIKMNLIYFNIINAYFVTNVTL